MARLSDSKFRGAVAALRGKTCSVETRLTRAEGLLDHCLAVPTVSIRWIQEIHVILNHVMWVFLLPDSNTGNRGPCAIKCESEVATDEAVYRSEYSDLEEWPPGWPPAKDSHLHCQHL